MSLHQLIKTILQNTTQSGGTILKLLSEVLMSDGQTMVHHKTDLKR